MHNDGEQQNHLEESKYVECNIPAVWCTRPLYTSQILGCTYQLQCLEQQQQSSHYVNFLNVKSPQEHVIHHISTASSSSFHSSICIHLHWCCIHQGWRWVGRWEWGESSWRKGDSSCQYGSIPWWCQRKRCPGGERNREKIGWEWGLVDSRRRCGWR